MRWYLAFVFLFFSATTGSFSESCDEVLLGITTCADFEATAAALDARYGPGESAPMGRHYHSTLADAKEIAPNSSGFLLLGKQETGVAGIRLLWELPAPASSKEFQQLVQLVESNITRLYGEPRADLLWWVEETDLHIACKRVSLSVGHILLCDFGHFPTMLRAQESPTTEQGSATPPE